MSWTKAVWRIKSGDRSRQSRNTPDRQQCKKNYQNNNHHNMNMKHIHNINAQHSTAQQRRSSPRTDLISTLCHKS